MMDTRLTRRRFLLALAASVFAAGVPLPIGLRRESTLFVDPSIRINGDGKSWVTAYTTLSAALGRLEPGGNICVRGTVALADEDKPWEFSNDPERPTHLWGYDARLKSGSFKGHIHYHNFHLA